MPSWVFITFLNMAKKITFIFFFQQHLAIQISPDHEMSFGGSTDRYVLSLQHWKDRGAGERDLLQTAL